MVLWNDRLQIQLGANMPARAERKLKKEEEEADAASMESFDVVLCLGIIDILQEYNVSKKLEHALKSIRFDSVSISAIDPLPYSRRFQEFLQKIFPENRVVAEKSPLPSPSP
jgi:1-phosphatidylinositol-4-phosphate 5-kinase